jgi:hypothetical protein
MPGALLSELPPGAEAALEAAMETGPGDGLPLVPPTRRALDAMLGAVQEGPGHVLGMMAPGMVDVTVEDAAVCAVAAGCKPSYFPVVLAALEAVMEPEFNFLAIQATTELASPLVIVHGPVAERLGVHSGSGCLGPGFRANATIGRAVRLAAVRLGMAVPGETDMATFGHGGKYAACFAEAACGWEPLHATRGFRAAQSAVTVVAADAPVNVNDYASGSAESVLRMISATMAYPGSNNAQGGGEVLVVISPQHLGLLASGGMSREDAQRALFEGARVPLTSFSPEIAERVRGRRPGLFDVTEPDAVPVADGPENILITVAGGPGSHTLFFPTYGETRAVTKAVRD